MAKLTITTFLTLDGVMQAPGGPDEDTSGGFRHGGWVVPHFDDELGAFMDEVFGRVDAFLLGRGTYDIFASHWPHVTDASDPIASRLNALPKYVATTTRTPAQLTWKGSTPVRDVVPAVAELKPRYDRELQVHGSPGLAQTLIAHDLVDEYNLILFPVVVGSGKRLFGAGAVPGGLELLRSRTTGAGVVITTYARAGALQTGTFGLET
jgi:dihydrofolate reductase